MVEMKKIRGKNDVRGGGGHVEAMWLTLSLNASGRADLRG